MTKVYEKAVKKLNELGEKLSARDFPFYVEIRHSDGSYFRFANAQYIVEVIDDVRFVLVWTEHCGYHAFFQEDLDGWKQYPM